MRPKSHWWADRSVWPSFLNQPIAAGPGYVSIPLQLIPGSTTQTMATITPIMSFEEVGNVQPTATLAQAGGSGAVCQRIVGQSYLGLVTSGPVGNEVEPTRGMFLKHAIVVGREWAGGGTFPDLWDAGDEAERYIVHQRLELVANSASVLGQPFYYDKSRLDWDVAPKRRLEAGEGLYYTIQASFPLPVPAAAHIATQFWFRALFRHGR